jgi:uncharacterized protein YaiL (DUF2058 family)
MSQSLREQLLQAGLVTEKQARQAARVNDRQRHRSRGRDTPDSATSSDARAAQATKVARDQALNRERQQKSAAKARAAELRQWIERHRVPPAESDEYFNFVDGPKVARIPVTAELRARLIAGTLLIVRCDGRYCLVPADDAAWVREHDPTALLALPAGEAGTAEKDDPYRDFVVPDDLVW